MSQTAPVNRDEPFTLHKNNALKSWFSALKYAWQTTIQVDLSSITTARALSGTLGFAIPLILGIAMGYPTVAVSIAGGAASIAAVRLSNTQQARTRTMLLACIGIAFSAFIGSITSHIAWLSVLTVGLWGFGAGLLVALGLSATIIGLQSAIALIILSHFMLDPLHATLQALLMLGGALFQTGLALIPLPGQKTAAERTALAALYQALASYASMPTNEQGRTAIRKTLLNAQNVLAENDLQRQHDMIYYELLEEAEQISMNIFIFKKWRESLEKNAQTTKSCVEHVEQFLQAVADELQMIAEDLKQVPHFLRRSQPSQQIKSSLNILRQRSKMPACERMLPEIITYGDALREQLYRAKKHAKSWNYRQHLQPVARRPKLESTSARFHDALMTIRAHLTLHSTAFRHALRMGVLLALATALYKLTPLPILNGYWIPMTALLVLRQDFGATITRGIARILGTLLGAILTTLLVRAFSPTNGLLVLIDSVAIFLALATFTANYTIFTLFFTVIIICLLALVHEQATMTAEARAIDTLIGGFMAFFMYLLWPTWEHSQVQDYVAKYLEKLQRYCVTILEDYADPTAYNNRAVQHYRMDIRLARSNLEASFNRASHEPGSYRIDADMAQALLEAATTIGQQTLALEAYLRAKPTRHILPEMGAIAKSVDEAFRFLITTVRSEQTTSPFPDLQAASQKLKHAEKMEIKVQKSTQTELHLVINEAKNLMRTLETIHHLFSSQEQQTTLQQT